MFKEKMWIYSGGDGEIKFNDIYKWDMDTGW
jgi:hypothetical protein